MAFVEELFPTDISYGAQGGPRFKTGIQIFGSGEEQRNQDWEKQRCEFDVSHALKTQAQLDTILNFFYARRGRYEGFRFKDWSDFVMAKQTIGIGDAATVDFQVYKRYASAAGSPFDRNLLKLVSGTVIVYLDDVVQSSGFTVNLNTGVVTFGTPPGASVVVAVECEFDVPCRFDTDHMIPQIEHYDQYTWGQIPIVELKNPA